jgi:hypothetical protein
MASCRHPREITWITPGSSIFVTVELLARQVARFTCLVRPRPLDAVPAAGDFLRDRRHPWHLFPAQHAGIAHRWRHRRAMGGVTGEASAQAHGDGRRGQPIVLISPGQLSSRLE